MFTVLVGGSGGDGALFAGIINLFPISIASVTKVVATSRECPPSLVCVQVSFSGPWVGSKKGVVWSDVLCHSHTLSYCVTDWDYFAFKD